MLTSSWPEPVSSCSCPTTFGPSSNQLIPKASTPSCAADEADGAAGTRALELVDVELAVAHYIRKMPKVDSGTGAFSAAEIPSASTRRVSSGSMIPSSQSRAVE